MVTPVIYKDKPLGLIQFEPRSRFGVLRDPIFEAIIRKEKIPVEEILLKHHGRVFRVNDIRSTYVFHAGTPHDDYMEYNPDLCIISSDYCYWHCLEREYKIDIRGERDHADLFFKNLTSEYYDFGIETTFRSFERYYEYNSNGHEVYYVILGKKNWKIPMAIKAKKAVPERKFCRDVIIYPYPAYSQETLLREFYQMDAPRCRPTRLPSYYKLKKRVIGVHREKGYIFGISYGIAETLQVKKKVFQQVEIEYWSKLVSRKSADQMVVTDEEILQEFDSLSKDIRRTLDSITVGYTLDQTTKTAWLLSIK